MERSSPSILFPSKSGIQYINLCRFFSSRLAYYWWLIARRYWETCAGVKSGSIRPASLYGEGGTEDIGVDEACPPVELISDSLVHLIYLNKFWLWM